jgi:DNA-binding transcriptional MerR regulator
MVTIQWSGGAMTTHTVACPPTGWHCVTDPTVVAQLRALAQELPDHQIAERLNAAGLRTKTGKPWTYPRVASMRAQHGIPTGCPIDPTGTPVRGDGQQSARWVAQRLGVSPSLMHVWIKQGVLSSEQRTVQSYRWIRCTEADVARLDGRHDWRRFPTVREIMRDRQCSREAVWDLGRAGAYVAYRQALGQQWEWRLEAVATVPGVPAPVELVTDAGESPRSLAGVSS